MYREEACDTPLLSLCLPALFACLSASLSICQPVYLSCFLCVTLICAKKERPSCKQTKCSDSTCSHSSSFSLVFYSLVLSLFLTASVFLSHRHTRTLRRYTQCQAKATHKHTLYLPVYLFVSLPYTDRHTPKRASKLPLKPTF